MRQDPDFATDMRRVLDAIWAEVMKTPPPKDKTTRQAPSRPEQSAAAELIASAMRAWSEFGRGLG